MSTTDTLGAFRVATKVVGLRVRVGSRIHDIPPRPAADWMAAMCGQEAFPLIGMMSARAQSEVMVDLLAGRVTIDQLTDIARRALAAVSGMLWWEADRLIRGAVAQWRTIGGELTRLGVDPAVRPLGAVLNAIYVIAVRSMTREERATFDSELSVPPPDASHADRLAVTAASVSALAAVFGPPPSMPPQ